MARSRPAKAKTNLGILVVNDLREQEQIVVRQIKLLVGVDVAFLINVVVSDRLVTGEGTKDERRTWSARDAGETQRPAEFDDAF